MYCLVKYFKSKCETALLTVVQGCDLIPNETQETQDEEWGNDTWPFGQKAFVQGQNKDGKCVEIGIEPLFFSGKPENQFILK